MSCCNTTFETRRKYQMHKWNVHSIRGMRSRPKVIERLRPLKGRMDSRALMHAMFDRWNGVQA